MKTTHRKTSTDGWAWPPRVALFGLKRECGFCGRQHVAWSPKNPADWLLLPDELRARYLCTRCFRRACGVPVRVKKPQTRRRASRKTGALFV